MVKILGYALTGIFGALIVGLVLAPLAILNGWVLSWLWLWFVVPLGLQPLSVVHAIGIAGIAGYLTKQYTGDSNGSEEERYEKLAYVIVSPFIALLTGYIVHLFM